MIRVKSAHVSIVLLLLGALLNCHFKRTTDTQLFQQQKNLTKTAIFEFLQRPDVHLRVWNGNKNKVKIDPWICIRDTFSQRDTVYFSHRMESDELTPMLSVKSFQLSIPDSLQSKYELVENNLNYGLDFSLIYQFSPLLPTKTPGVFMLQIYHWFNICGDQPLRELKDTSCLRLAEREYIKFQVINNNVTYLGTSQSKHPENDDIWLRTFLRPSLIDMRNLYLLKKE